MTELKYTLESRIFYEYTKEIYKISLQIKVPIRFNFSDTIVNIQCAVFPTGTVLIKKDNNNAIDYYVNDSLNTSTLSAITEFLGLNFLRYNTKITISLVESFHRQAYIFKANYQVTLLQQIWDDLVKIYEIPQSGSSQILYKRTHEKVVLSKNVTRLIYKGPRNMKFVRLNGQYMRLKDAKSQLRL